MSNNSLVNSEKFKAAEAKIYPSMKALVEATGLPLRLIKIAKVKGYAGFDPSNRIDWRILKPILEDNIDELLTEPLTLKEQLQKKDLILKDLEIKKRQRNLIEPEDVKQFLVEVATSQSVTIKKVMSELPPKLLGLSEPEIKTVIDNVVADIFKGLKEAEAKVDGLTS